MIVKPSRAAELSEGRAHERIGKKDMAMSEAAVAARMRLEDQICFAVHATAHAFAQAYKPLLAPLRLTYPQYLVMLLLWEKDNRSVGELGGPLFLDSGTLSPLLKRLQGLGYVSRSVDPADERVTRIALTRQGAALRDKAAAIPQAMLGSMNLDLGELASLREQVKRLGAALRETG